MRTHSGVRLPFPTNPAPVCRCTHLGPPTRARNCSLAGRSALWTAPERRIGTCERPLVRLLNEVNGLALLWPTTRESI